MSQPYRREPECSLCEDAGVVYIGEIPEPGAGIHGLTGPCICRQPEPEPAPPVDDSTPRKDVGYVS